LLVLAAWAQSARAEVALQVVTEQVSEAVDGEARALDAFIAANQAPLLTCYGKLFAQFPTAPLSALRLRVVAAANGQVVEATILEGAPIPPMLASCLVAAARAWSLPVKKARGFTAVHLLTPTLRVAAPFVPVASLPPVPPRASLVLGALKAPAEVDLDVLVRYVRTRKSALLQCYEFALKDGQLKGPAKAKVSFTISVEGQAVDIEASARPDSERLTRCLATVLKAWRLPFHLAREAAVEQSLEYAPPPR
jgi:hypothetical protein